MFYAQLITLFSLWQKCLSNAQLQKLRQHPHCVFSLQFYHAEQGAFELILDFSPGCSSFFIAKNISESLMLPRKPAQGFAMVLRKHLMGHRMVSITQVSDDKVLVLVFKSGFSLVVELKGRYGNLFLCNEKKEVVASLRQDTSPRHLKVGALYRAPSKPARLKFQRADPLNLLQEPESVRQRVFAEWALKRYALFLQKNRIQRLIKFQKRQLQRLQNRIAQAQSDFNALDRQSTYIQYAELLQGAYAKPPSKYANSVDVIDYYAADFGAGEPTLITIPLQPDLGLTENIAWYSRRAKKIERAAEYAMQTLPDLELRYANLDRALNVDMRLLADIRKGVLPEERVINALEVRVASLQQANVAEPTKQGPLKSKVYRCLGESGNIWVGKSAKDNHELTFKLAKGNDYWFHVQDSAGSHVVLRGVKEPAASQLEEAARLAAHYSPLRKAFEQGEPIAVSYTQVKYVKAIKGAAPGLVQLQKFKTYRVCFKDG